MCLFFVFWSSSYFRTDVAFLCTRHLVTSPSLWRSLFTECNCTDTGNGQIPVAAYSSLFFYSSHASWILGYWTVLVWLRVKTVIKKESVLVISDLLGLSVECFNFFSPSVDDGQCHIHSELRVLQLSTELVLIFQVLACSRVLLFNVTLGKLFLCRWLWFVTLTWNLVIKMLKYVEFDGSVLQ